MTTRNVFTIPAETPAQRRLRRVVRRAQEERTKANVFAVTPGAPINRALFQAGFPLGVAQRVEEPKPQRKSALELLGQADLAQAREPGSIVGPLLKGVGAVLSPIQKATEAGLAGVQEQALAETGGQLAVAGFTSPRARKVSEEVAARPRDWASIQQRYMDNPAAFRLVMETAVWAAVPQTAALRAPLIQLRAAKDTPTMVRIVAGAVEKGLLPFDLVEQAIGKTAGAVVRPVVAGAKAVVGRVQADIAAGLGERGAIDLPGFPRGRAPEGEAPGAAAPAPAAAPAAAQPPRVRRAAPKPAVASLAAQPAPAGAGAAPSPAPQAAGQGLPPPAPAALSPGRVRPTAGPVVGPGEVPLRTPPPGGLPSGRVPGGPRAVPTGPQGVRVVSQGAEPPRPPIEPSVAPPSGEFPSGRRPGGIGHRGPPPPPRDPLAMIDAALDPQKEPFLKRITKGIPDDWYDSNYPLKELERLTGIPARKAAQVVPGSAMKAEEVVRRFYLPAVGDMVNTEYRNIQRFMVLKRIDDIGAINPGSAFPGGLNRMDAVDALTQMEKQLGAERFAKISQAANDLWDLNHNHVLRPLRLEGLISARAFLEMQTSHPHYIPFKRADFVQDLHESFSGRPVASVGSTGIKRLTEAGSVRALDEPLERLLREPFHVQSLIAKNRAAKTIIEALQELEDITGEEMVRWVGPKATFRRIERVTGQPLKVLKKGEHSQVWETVSFFKDGEKHMADIPARFARVARGLDAEPLGPVVKFIGITNQPLRLGATALNAFFLPRNIIRDAMSAMFRENLFPFGPDHIAGLWAAIRKNSLFTEAANEGALLSGLMENMKGPKMFQRPVLGSITLERPQDALLLPLRLAALPYRAITGVNIIAERATRLGVYRKLGRIQGLDPLERAVRTRDATVDFSKMGHTMRVVNHVIPFSNAAVQGTANMARTIRDHPVRAAAYAALFGGVVAMVRLNNQRFETSRLIPDYEYTRNWVIQVGEGERKDGTKYPLYFKIPKGEIAASLVFPTEAMFSWAQQAGDKSATEMLLDAGIEAAQVVSPVQDVTSVLPAAAQTGVGLATGIDPFSGIPIVSRREENLPPEQQFGTESSTVAIALGRTFGISPRKIDFAIRDYLAGAGETTNWMLGQVLELIGYKRPEAFGEALEPQPEGAELLSRQPGVRTLLGTRATQEERRGWEQFNQAVEETNRAVGRIGDLNRLGVRLGEVGDSIQEIELTPAQRARYQELAGQQALVLLAWLIQEEAYKKAKDETKRLMLQELLADARDAARAEMVPLLREQGAIPPLSTPTPTPTPPLTPPRRLKVRRAEPTPVGAGR